MTWGNGGETGSGECRGEAGSAGDAAVVPVAAQAVLDALFPIFSSPYEFPPYLKLLQPREWRAGRRIRAMHDVLLSTATGKGEGGLVDPLYDSGLDDGAVAEPALSRTRTVRRANPGPVVRPVAAIRAARSE